MANRFVEFVSRAICIGLLLFQVIIINAYLSIHYSPIWWSWIIGDVTVLIVWAACSWFSTNGFPKIFRFQRIQRESVEDQHEIKYAYIAWLAYAGFLVPRIVLIFQHIANTLDEKEVLGPNFLKMSVACTPLIYFLIVYGSYNKEAKIPRNLSVKGIAASGAFDLFDSIELLEFLFVPEEEVHCPHGYMIASLIVVCMSMFLPVLSLYALRHKTKPGRVSSLTYKICYEFLNLSLVNLPNLIIRSVLWHVYSMDVSVLLMKNVMGIISASYELFEYLGEFRPILCKKCDDWFEKNSYREHKRNCRVGNRLQQEAVELTTVAAELNT